MAGESPAVDHLPFESNPIRLGKVGLNLAKPIDSLNDGELSRLTNGVTGQGDGIDTRPGLTRIASAGVNVHSISRLNPAASFTRFWGIDQSWYRGAGPGLTNLEGGFSGDPLIMVPFQTEFGGESWMYVADRLKMRKSSVGSPSLQIGLPKPLPPTAVGVAEILTTNIASFDATDNTAAANWKAWGGPNESGSSAATKPTLTDIVGLQLPGAVQLVCLGTSGTNSDNVPEGYTCGMAIPKALDLSKLQGGTVPSTDDDVIHVYLKFNTPTVIDEVRIYFVVSPYTAPLVDSAAALDLIGVPGLSLLYNTSAYMYAYRPSDYTDFIGTGATGADAAETIRNNALLNGFSDNTVSKALLPSAPGQPGAGTWSEFGKIGLPIRKSDFMKLGAAGKAGTDWSTVTGIWVVVKTNTLAVINVGFDNLFLTGGHNVDSSEPDSQPFDYRLTNRDKRTGAESNPSDVSTLPKVDAMRQRIVVQPVAFGDVNIIQLAYRRGGSLTDNWYFVGQNAVDGGQIVDDTLDATALVAGPVEIDHDQPITTSDASGNAVYNQPVPVLFGPIDGYMFALGDPFRPGDVYWSKRDEPDHWPAANHATACPPSEELMNGGKFVGQGFVFSRERLYSVQVNFANGGIVTNPTDCAEGLISRWGFAIGLGGIFFVARDAVRITTGGRSEILSDNIRPLFHPPAAGVPTNGYYPIDFSQPNKIRLEVSGDDLWFGFQDTNGGRPWYVYSLTYKTWRHVGFGPSIGAVYGEPTLSSGTTLLCGSVTNGRCYSHTGFDDDGTDITVNVRTGAMNLGRAREEKLLGDLEVWGNFFASNLTIQAFLNAEKTTNTAATVATTSNYDRYIFDTFGTTPQHANTVSINMSWVGSRTGLSTVQRLAVGVAIQPEITFNRATTWEPLNDKGEAYLMGCWIDSDTGGVTRVVNVEVLLGGATSIAATLNITNTAGRKQWFSWPAVHADMVRLRPQGSCLGWMLFGCGWLTNPEPPRIAVWDTNFEDLGDTYYTGLDVTCDTFGLAKNIQIYVDGVLIQTSTLQCNGKRHLHVTMPAARGHIYRFVATDGNVGLLYAHEWVVDPEPKEQANWNQNYTIAGTHADKWLKGVLLECDTFGQPKTVTIEVDGNVVSTQTVQTVNRKVVQLAFPQALGRVFRIYPTDGNAGRLYTAGWIFDEEPYQLTRYETQEQTHGIEDWHIPIYGQVVIKSAAAVSLTILGYGQNGALLSTNIYTIPTTSGVKAMVYVPFNPQKGTLYKYLFTSAQGFWLYREESYVWVQPWSGGQLIRAKPFGDDDLDPSRPMRNAALTAAKGGGEAR